MAQVQSQRFCKTCGKETLHASQRLDGGLGCLLTLLTCGLFFPVWCLLELLDAMKMQRCQVCGRQN